MYIYISTAYYGLKHTNTKSKNTDTNKHNHKDTKTNTKAKNTDKSKHRQIQRHVF